jgi:hypothetical protein
MGVWKKQSKINDSKQQETARKAAQEDGARYGFCLPRNLIPVETFLRNMQACDEAGARPRVPRRQELSLTSLQ